MEEGILKWKFHCTIDHLFGWFGLACFETKNVSFLSAVSKPVKQEVNGTTILPTLVFPDWNIKHTMQLMYAVTSWAKTIEC